MTTAGGGRSGRITWCLAALFAVAIGAAYSNSFGIGYRFDDWHVLENNPHVRSLRNFPRFFVDANTTSVLHENKDLRPVLMATFALNHAVSGDEPWSWHLLNVLLHWIAVLLVFRIARDHLWLGDEAVPVAATAALIVAVHPLNTEPLDYLSARSALLTAVFYLAAFEAGVRRRAGTCLLFYALALLTKAIAVTLPVMLLVHALLARTREPRHPLPWRLLAGLVALTVAGGVYRALLLPPWTVASARQTGITPWVYFITEWSAYLYYLRLFVWPDALVVDRLDYPYARSVLEPQAWASLLALVALGVLAWRARRRWPALTFATAWYLITLAPESSLFPLAEPVNEHRPYLAMLGLGAAAGFGVWTLAAEAARRSRVRWAAAALVGVVAVALGSATWARNRTWRDDYTLWLDATRKAPGNTRAWLNAGHAAMAINRRGEARRLLLEAHRLSPCYAYVQMNLSALEAGAGRPDASLRWADQAVACNPGLALTHYYRGDALERLHRDGEALAAYRRVTAIDDQHSKAWQAQGRLLEKQQQWADAATAYDRAFATNPLSAEAVMQAGLVHHYRLQDPAGAVERYRTVLRLVPTHYGAHYQIAQALLASGRTAEATEAWAAFVPLAEAIGDRASIERAPAALRTARR